MGTASGSRTHIHWRQRARLPRDIKDCIPLVQYAREQYLTRQAVRYRILTRRLVGYKIAGRWYVDPRSNQIPSDF